MLSFGCGGEQPPAQGNNTGNETPQGNVTPGGNVTPPEEPPGEVVITNCEDGTFVGNCSASKPKICDIFGNLIDDAETCGCPPKSLPAGRECIYTCSDGTNIEECSADKPYYCNENGKLESISTKCGCPEGYDVLNETCRNTCNDTTVKLTCSVKNKPLYCSEKYELVMNPPKCGCHDWEMFENGGCFNPSGKTYSQGETVRINENVSLKVDDFEEKSCGGNMYGLFVLTVINNGETAYEMKNTTFRLKRGNSGTIFERPKEGCSAGSLYRWGSVSPGETRYGNVWSLVYGGTGDFYIEYDVEYPTVMKTFKIDFRE